MLPRHEIQVLPATHLFLYNQHNVFASYLLEVIGPRSVKKIIDLDNCKCLILLMNDNRY
jgi:hypothetical protein